MRTKFTLKAPPGGGGEAVIEGTYYWPDETGSIETNNPAHVATLQRHGYTITEQVEIAPPPTSLGIIDYEEMGRNELTQQLAIRGVTFDGTGGRAALEEAAQAWNDARRGRMNRYAERAADYQDITTPASFGGAATPPSVQLTPEQAQAFQEWWASQKAGAAPPVPLAPAEGPKGDTEPQPVTQAVGQAATTVEQGKTRPALKHITADEINAMTISQLKAYMSGEGISYNPATPKPTLQRIAREAAGIREAA